MNIDLLHNKIVAATISERFSESISANLIPKLQEKYGDDLEGIQMYEDYLSSGFAVGKTRYYPLTVITITGGACTEWISWNMRKGAFEDDIPFAYVGEEDLEFELVSEIPDGFAEKLENKSIYFEGGEIKLRVETTATDITVLSGRYSQTFIDEMARQLGDRITALMSVSGIENSSIELALVFAPDTYMEHTSESVTYRRLLLVDKASAPRDFWIKWTRLDGNGAYTIADDVTAADILFEIGENVPQKIKEKEYRFLTKAGKDKYHNAMGRKNVTEWRDVIKRAIRRGDLERIEAPAPVEEEVMPEAVEAAAPEAEVAAENELDLAMEMARRVIDSAEAEVAEAEEYIDDEELDEEEEADELEAFYAEEESEPAKSRAALAADDEEARELEEITRMAMEALKMAKEEAAEEEPAEEETAESDEPALITFAEEEDEEIDPDAIVIVPEDPTAEEYESPEYEEIDDEEALEDEEAIAEARSLEPEAEEDAHPAEAPAPSEKSISAADLEAKIRGELEARIRLEYETLARQKAEEEAERLRREQEQLRIENERLQDRARREKAEWTRIEENRRAEAERLRVQIENQVRQEAKERERLAEAARQAVEEQHRLEAEKLRAERAKLEEERRADEERRRKEEEARIEAARRAEAERLRREEEARLAKEKAEKAEEGYVDNNYTYISKTVKLLFRRSVDPNIVTRIHEILKATLEYYGKQKVYMRIKATVPDSTTVCLEFLQFPQEEMELLSNIIKVIGNSGLGIAKAILE